MKKLESKFIGKGEVKGFEFEKIQETENALLYKVQTGEHFHYEVFKRKIQDSHPRALVQEQKEAYPKSNAFGVWAWCFDTHEKAVSKLLKIEVDIVLKQTV